MSVTFTIPGPPHAKQRPRFSKKTGRTFTPDKTVRFEDTVRAIALQHFAAPLTGPIRLTVYATFQPPKSWSKKKTAETINGPHIQRPDLDNLAKSISDGLNRVAYVDDGQIFEMTCRKVWGPEPKTVVIVEAG